MIIIAVSCLIVIAYLKPDIPGIFRNCTSLTKVENSSKRTHDTISNELRPTALINFCNGQLGNQVLNDSMRLKSKKID